MDNRLTDSVHCTPQGKANWPTTIVFCLHTVILDLHLPTFSTQSPKKSESINDFMHFFCSSKSFNNFSFVGSNLKSLPWLQGPVWPGLTYLQPLTSLCTCCSFLLKSPSLQFFTWLVLSTLSQVYSACPSLDCHYFLCGFLLISFMRLVRVYNYFK